MYDMKNLEVQAAGSSRTGGNEGVSGLQTRRHGATEPFRRSIRNSSPWRWPRPNVPIASSCMWSARKLDALMRRSLKPSWLPRRCAGRCDPRHACHEIMKWWRLEH
jgi:hypothetical protein